MHSNCSRHTSVIDTELISDKSDSDIVGQYNKHVYNFTFKDVIRYEFICSKNLLDAYEVVIEKAENGYKVNFDDIGIVKEDRNVKLGVRYNGLE